MSERHYYLGPWQWVTDEDGERWQAPEGTVGLVDLRPLRNVDTFGFFATDRPLSSEDYIRLGDSLEDKPDLVTRSAWTDALKITATLEKGTLLDLLWDTLTVGSDPDGDERAKPIMPCVSGQMELHLGGHSLVRARRFAGVSDPAWPAIQRVCQNDYAIIEAHAKSQADAAHGKVPPHVEQKMRELPLRFLATRVAKLGVPAQLLVPSGSQFQGTRRPETTYTDNFNRADGALGNSAEGWAWNALVGSWAIVSNVARGNSAPCWARAEADLSSSDHYVQAAQMQTANSALWLPARFASDALTAYYVSMYPNAISGYRKILKVIAGSATDLDSAAWTNGAEGEYWTQRNTPSGSTITHLLDGVERAITDTSISTGVRCGIGGYRSFGNPVWTDDFVCADIGAPPSGNVPYSLILQHGANA